ncbi:MAG: hypothetical protein QE271_05965 [Bacteriovoracaceae bacterium]|nr:hypothetical protein [Bacteriovoracaceae bacterium]
MSLFFLIQSCTTGGPRYQKIDPTMANQPGSLSMDWFLAPIPDWINFSPTNQCEKENNWTYLDISKISPQLGLSYPQALELQARINQYPDFLKLPETERFKLFFDELTKVINKISLINPIPEVAKNLVIISIDSIKATKNWKSILTTLSENPKWDTFIPIIVSECLSTQTLKNILSELPPNSPFQWSIGAEFVSTFSFDGKNQYQWGIGWDKFFLGKKISYFNEWQAK